MKSQGSGPRPCGRPESGLALPILCFPIPVWNGDLLASQFLLPAMLEFQCILIEVIY